jgi:hypothetical protein
MTSNDFAKKFNFAGEHELIIWKDDNSSYIGFSILKDYPEDCGFIPAKYKNGRPDHKVLIKIGFDSKQKQDDGNFRLLTNTIKYSRYLGDHFGYNFEDENSPTRESVNISNLSPQPIDLNENFKFSFNELENVFKDNKDYKNISPEEIIKYLFDIHIKTIKSGKAFILKAKLKARDITCEKILSPIIKLIIGANSFLFDKIIIEDKDNWLAGLMRPYKHNQLSTIYPQNIPFFKSDIKISKKSIIFVSISMIIIWFLVKELREINEVFSISIVLLLILFFDEIIPHLALCLINNLIRLRHYFGNKNFKF